MSESDLTVIYLTANQHPQNFTSYQRRVLLDAIKGHSLITVSREPVDLPGESILDDKPKSHINMYAQMLKAAKMAKTPYIASAEDDVLYPPDHFNFYRPSLDTFAFNMHRWILFTWVPNVFSMKRRRSNCTLIAPRELFIEAWEERFAKYPPEKYPPRYVGEVGRPNLDEWLGVKVQKSIEVWSKIAVVQFNHPHGTDSLGKRKKMGEVKAIEIPYWGKAQNIVKEYR